MTSSHLRTGAAVFVLASVLGLAAWGPKKPEPAPVPVIVAPPPPPPTTLSTGVVDAAAAYEDFLHQATVLSPAFVDGAQVQTELKTGETWQPTQLAHGAIAYSAVVALQDPDFVAAVKAYAKDPAGRAQLVNLIYADPRYAAQIPGASGAATRVIARLTADGAALQKTGGAIKQAAYDVQHQSWSKQVVMDRDGRLAAAKQLGDNPVTASVSEASFLLQAAVTGQGLDPTPLATTVSLNPTAAMSAATPAAGAALMASTTPLVAPPAAGAPDAAAAPAAPYTEGVYRGLAIAALAVLGAAGDNNSTQISAMMDEGIGPRCLNLAKLNHYQCLAVAKPHYEDMFCLGQHALMETGKCLQKMAGTAAPEVLEVTRMDAEKAAKEAAAKARKSKAIHHPARRKRR
ncbi:MAG TPA: hypothetical protein VG407_02815 [Caulobacteraceae bacterium]|jgi:hypothetical protein|nr:hypothetical protein [Caulobacteraceae bacterium]